jgi:hypothetical protein
MTLDSIDKNYFFLLQTDSENNQRTFLKTESICHGSL